MAESVSSKSESNNLRDLLPGLAILGILSGLFLWFLMSFSLTEFVFGSSEEQSVSTTDRRAGFHCLSGWDGSHSGVKGQVRALMDDPGSFQHVSTKITPRSADNTHLLYMTYRGSNAFGATITNQATARVSTNGCKATLLSLN